ncbi:TetR/AcrR family transcriptional regulator [Curtobacterium sp. ISL-83]|uniref:TetR/AcrR family transcriptional regulator n=1 Tax=Curtobacterium sp. ISL-83 TaxID=2819145 RepID=UPI001BE6E2BB|nr:TetR/AcrR family transcriptional regulator [Curtobacterium sp. ISL-83]MBT2503575.1 TetR/AcrR family transcriptional regulator [Curtobacterium sp. ISL-83]
METTGDPRFLRSQEAIITAARQLLLREGPPAITHNRVAEEAGIGRATVYRHWPRTDQLLAEAMATVPLPFFDTPSSPYIAWLRRELTAIARQLEQDDVLAVTTTLASTSLWDPAMDTRRAGFAQIVADKLADGLREAEQCGELVTTSALSDAAALAVGPIYYRATIERASIDGETIERCVQAVGHWK